MPMRSRPGVGQPGSTHADRTWPAIQNDVVDSPGTSQE